MSHIMTANGWRRLGGPVPPTVHPPYTSPFQVRALGHKTLIEASARDPANYPHLAAYMKREGCA